MSTIQKLEDIEIFLEIEGSSLFVQAKNIVNILSIEDVKNLITELNAIHTEMVVNKHKETLNKNK